MPEGIENWWCYYSPVLDLPKNWWCYYGYTYTKLAKIGGAKAPPAPPVPATLGYKDMILQFTKERNPTNVNFVTKVFLAKET